MVVAGSKNDGAFNHSVVADHIAVAAGNADGHRACGLALQLELEQPIVRYATTVQISTHPTKNVSVSTMSAPDPGSGATGTSTTNPRVPSR